MSILISDPIKGVSPDGINYILLRTIHEILRKIPIHSYACSMLFRGSTNPNFSWMMYCNRNGIRRLYCSITGRENGGECLPMVRFYEILLNINNISVYSYDWKLYADWNIGGKSPRHISTTDLDPKYSSCIKQEIDQFKIVMLDILQDISASMLDEFSITIDEPTEYLQAQRWFHKADKEVRINVENHLK